MKPLISTFFFLALATAAFAQEEKKDYSEPLRVIEAWLTASVLYLAAAYTIAIALRRLERRYAAIR